MRKVVLPSKKKANPKTDPSVAAGHGGQGRRRRGKEQPSPSPRLAQEGVERASLSNVCAGKGRGKEQVSPSQRKAGRQRAPFSVEGEVQVPPSVGKVLSLPQRLEFVHSPLSEPGAASGVGPDRPARAARETGNGPGIAIRCAEQPSLFLQNASQSSWHTLPLHPTKARTTILARETGLPVRHMHIGNSLIPQNATSSGSAAQFQPTMALNNLNSEFIKLLMQCIILQREYIRKTGNSEQGAIENWQLEKDTPPCPGWGKNNSGKTMYFFPEVSTVALVSVGPIVGSAISNAAERIAAMVHPQAGPVSLMQGKSNAEWMAAVAGIKAAGTSSSRLVVPLMNEARAHASWWDSKRAGRFTFQWWISECLIPEKHRYLGAFAGTAIQTQGESSTEPSRQEADAKHGRSLGATSCRNVPPSGLAEDFGLKDSEPESDSEPDSDEWDPPVKSVRSSQPPASAPLPPRPGSRPRPCRRSVSARFRPRPAASQASSGEKKRKLVQKGTVLSNDE